MQAGQHRGIDVGGAVGESVRAPIAGTVSFAGSVPAGGRALTIRTGDGYSVTLLQLGSIAVQRGDEVGEGARVGAVGESSDAVTREPHVHLGVRRTVDEEGYLDPLAFLPERPRVVLPAPAPAGGAASGAAAARAAPSARRAVRASACGSRCSHSPRPTAVRRRADVERGARRRRGRAAPETPAGWKSCGARGRPPRQEGSIVRAGRGRALARGRADVERGARAAGSRARRTRHGRDADAPSPRRRRPGAPVGSACTPGEARAARARRRPSPLPSRAGTGRSRAAGRLPGRGARPARLLGGRRGRRDRGRAEGTAYHGRRMSRFDLTTEDLRRGGMAVCVGPRHIGHVAGLRRAVGHVRALPPARAATTS